MKDNALFTLPSPTKAGDTRVIANLLGASLPLTIANIADKQQRLMLLVVPDNQTALKLQPEIQQFTGQSCHVFPDWETLPYDNFSPHQDIISDRIARLYQLSKQTAGILIIPVSTLLQRVMPKSFLVQHALMVKKGDLLSLEKLRHQLELSGYRHVDQVIQHGEYASRGSILDLFPMGSNHPFRIDFFDDEVDTIREFDPENQRSTQELDHINLLPAHEFPTDDEAVEQFRVRWRERFEARREPESIYQQVSKKTWPAGIEYWQPLFFERTETLFDYLPNDTLLLTKGDLESAANQFLTDAEYRFDQRRVDPLRPLLPPIEIWQNVEELFSAFKAYPRIKLQIDSTEDKAGRQNAPIKDLPDLTVNQQLKEPLGSLRKFTEDFKGKVVFSVETEGRREAMLDLLARIKIRPFVSANLEEAINAPTSFAMVVGPAERGFVCEKPAFALICESNLLGERVIQQRRRGDKKAAVNSDTMIRNLAELQIGQPVVHLEHGVGRYLGLQTLEAGGIETEYVTLEYQQGSKLYVPVASLHLISRYSGGAEETAPLHRLGGEAWEKARKKAAEKVRDVAAELLDVYAKRATKPGFAFKHDREAYLDFCSSFPFEETPDQSQAINAVLSDMCQPIAMDRLVCGDVGFGKTEVAMRATFLSVNNNKQVAVLVPTTLLAQQHFENFRDRFANQPVRVEVLSRFKSAKEQKAILADCAEGKIDILIGTHKLLQSDVKFEDLGLLIVDEEHRFGVRQKEKVKAMRADVDILTLTATPIPRTLNMAMSGMRDLSIIATPPSRRLAIKTFVREREDAMIREALLREIMRGGQVYFLHNDVDSIEKAADELAELVPEARVTVAHGQMRERELERIMSDFYHQRFNVLVCTTIIETGIDVPTANTILMNRADRLGLAQLHQLRGRVGRSHHQAYAYLLTPHPKRMTKDAVKRLEAISSLEDLGAGFTLATHDLEIRGAGELLGEEQSGQIHSVGFTLYMEMLEQAVEALKEGKEPSLEDLLNQQTDVELRLPALLPDSYIPDINTRLSLYKRIAGTKSQDEIEELRVELIDRFGLLPDAASNLLKVQQIKLDAAKLGVRKIDAHDRGGVIEFNQNAQIDPGFLVGLLQSHPTRYRFDGPTKLRIVESLTDRRERVEFIETLLTQFADNLLVA
ncbi:transcription-repair coupling factor [Enterovibrio makurazakiensis]|uniref:Transcription-repair-coupling factor n=1 Tax=Enterovibrio gelatinilyticus TaxID=2899819 RepID=A0ABT5R4U7_9GAMM|nr:transcription-repair coupling factor [Enterovibrio sp. ZSDZ42]MDD1794771.1 transcription-repair coupling factor [Enterovibrio sp. ZSDZ42]